MDGVKNQMLETGRRTMGIRADTAFSSQSGLMKVKTNVLLTPPQQRHPTTQRTHMKTQEGKEGV